MLVIKSHEIVWFHYKDGSQGAWCKLKDGQGTYGHYNRTQWVPIEGIPTPLEYTEILELANEYEIIERHLQQLYLLYKLSKGLGKADDNV